MSAHVTPGTAAFFLQHHTRRYDNTPSLLIVDGENDANECPICLEDYDTSLEAPLQITGIDSCNHIFGDNCLAAILNSNPDMQKKCPLCRKVWISALGARLGVRQGRRRDNGSHDPIVLSDDEDEEDRDEDLEMVDLGVPTPRPILNRAAWRTRGQRGEEIQARLGRAGEGEEEVTAESFASYRQTIEDIRRRAARNGRRTTGRLFGGNQANARSDGPMNLSRTAPPSALQSNGSDGSDIEPRRPESRRPFMALTVDHRPRSHGRQRWGSTIRGYYRPRNRVDAPLNGPRERSSSATVNPSATPPRPVSPDRRSVESLFRPDNMINPELPEALATSEAQDATSLRLTDMRNRLNELKRANGMAQRQQAVGIERENRERDQDLRRQSVEQFLDEITHPDMRRELALDGRAEALDEREQGLNERERAVNAREQLIDQREEILNEREERANRILEAATRQVEERDELRERQKAELDWL